MHPSAYKNCQKFFEIYCDKISSGEEIVVAEIGSQNVNGSIRSVFPVDWKYIGLDFVEGNGVDVVIKDPMRLPLEKESIDIVVTSSCFEHAEFFWVTFLEGIRALKPHGLMYVNVPSNGVYHGYPGDCWRFFPDAGRSLANWARVNNYKTVLLESYMTADGDAVWDDYVAVFLKDEAYAPLFNDHIICHYDDYYNARTISDNINGPLIRLR